MSLRCQLPTEDLDALVSVTGDDDLVNLLEEYDAASKDRIEPLKIRAFLFPRTPSTKLSSWNPHHHLPRQNSSSPGSAAGRVSPTSISSRWWAAPRQASSRSEQGRPHRYLVHNGSHWE